MKGMRAFAVLERARNLMEANAQSLAGRASRHASRESFHHPHGGRCRL